MAQDNCVRTIAARNVNLPTKTHKVPDESGRSALKNSENARPNALKQNDIMYLRENRQATNGRRFVGGEFGRQAKKMAPSECRMPICHALRISPLSLSDSIRAGNLGLDDLTALVGADRADALRFNLGCRNFLHDPQKAVAVNLDGFNLGNVTGPDQG